MTRGQRTTLFILCFIAIILLLISIPLRWKRKALQTENKKLEAEINDTIGDMKKTEPEEISFDPKIKF